MKKIIKEKGIYILSFCIPWIIVVIHSILRDGWPLGDGSILRGDASVQYYQLCVELWNKIHSGQSLFYSWNAGDGFDFYLNMAYYLISPFTIIILLVPKQLIADAVQTVMILKWSFMYISMLYYFIHTEHNKIINNKRLISFVLASIYALSNCVLMRLALFNWNDVLILFPLILLQLEKMIKKDEWKLYTVLLWLAMICNFYTAYQVCIFLIIWFFINIDKDTENKINKFFMFVGSSVVAALSAGIIIIPSVINGFDRYSRIYENAAEEKKLYITKTLVSLWEFVTKLFVFDDTSNDFSFAPNMYFSIGAVVLTLLYLFVISKAKYKNITALILVTLGVFFGAVNYIWHGFSVPHGIYYRFIYLLVFMCDFVILDLLVNIDNYKLKSVIVLAAIEIVIFIISFLKINILLDFYVYFVTAMLFALYQIILILYCKKSIKKQHLISAFSILILGELAFNAVFQLREYNLYSVSQLYDYKTIDSLIDDIELKDGERVEIIRNLSNDGLLFNIPVHNIFMSYCNGENVRMHKGLGMSYSDDASYGLYGGSPLINLIFNIRYAILENDIELSDMEKIKSESKYGLYHDNRILGLGYMVDSNILQWKGADKGPFESQNEFVFDASGVNGIFEIVNPEIKFYSTTVFSPDNEYLKSGYYYYEYISEEPADQEYSIMEFTVPKDMDLYVTADNGKAAYSIVFVDDKQVYADSSRFRQQTFHIGNVKKGQNIKICAMHEAEIGERIDTWYQFACFNEDVYEQVYEKLSQNVFEIDIMNDSYVSGHIHADKDGVMMTSIQAVDGFDVYVDGNQVDINSVGALIGVPLKAGDHKVEFKYITPYFKAGAVASSVGIIIFALLCIMTMKKKDAKK